ncbi:MAG: hypothetical protein KC656_11730, partial [Myxococcales bacterium]|nr:hypothetical protein [Myxococcales bacterium]
SFSLPGATDVHLGGGVACARSPTRFVCLGEYGLAEASRPGGKLGRDANQALCDLDAGVCIDRIRMRGRSLDLTWVEAGW